MDENLWITLLLFCIYISFCFFLHYYSNFGILPEDNFLKAIQKVWKKNPILDISLTKKEGYEEITLMHWNIDNYLCECSHVDDYETNYNEQCNDFHIEKGCYEYNKYNNSTKLYNTTLYVLYYKADYLTLYKRIRTDKGDGKLCKHGYKKCGYLDSLNNVFCINEKKKEICPINELFFLFGDDGKINKIKTNNKDKELPVFNQLIVSENEKATILDIGEFFTLDNINNPKRKRYPDEIFYSLRPFKYFRPIKTSEFFLENKLIKGNIPEKYNIKNLYLFYSIYPGINIKKSFNMKDLFIIKKKTRIIIKIFIPLLLFIKILFIICNIHNNYIRQKIQNNQIFFFITALFYMIFIIINLYHYKIKNRLYRILNDYNIKYKLKSFKTQYENRFIDIIFLFLEILIFFVDCTINFVINKKCNNNESKKIEKDENENLKNKQNKNPEENKDKSEEKEGVSNNDDKKTNENSHSF